MRKGKAFTLLELLETLGIGSIVIIAIFYYAASSLSQLNRVTAIASSLESARFVASRISDDVVQSSGEMPGSVRNKLVLKDVTYEFINEKVKRTEGSDVSYLTIENEIKDLSFKYISGKLINIAIAPKTGKVMKVAVYARN